MWTCGRYVTSKFKLLNLMIVTKIKNKNSMISVLILICFSTLQDDIEAKPTQPIVKLDLFMIFFFFLDIVLVILNIKNMTHFYFGWDHNQDVAILAFLKH